MSYLFTDVLQTTALIRCIQVRQLIFFVRRIVAQSRCFRFLLVGVKHVERVNLVSLSFFRVTEDTALTTILLDGLVQSFTHYFGRDGPVRYSTIRLEKVVILVAIAHSLVIDTLEAFGDPDQCRSMPIDNFFSFGRRNRLR